MLFINTCILKVVNNTQFFNNIIEFFIYLIIDSKVIQEKYFLQLFYSYLYFSSIQVVYIL